MTKLREGKDALLGADLEGLYGRELPPGLIEALGRSRKVVSAWEGDTLVGAARLVGDSIYAVAMDVAVLPGPLQKPIEVMLIAGLLAGGDQLRAYLPAVREAGPLLAELGFRWHRTGYMLPPGAPRPLPITGGQVQYRRGLQGLNWKALDALYTQVPGLVGGLAAKGNFEEVRQAFQESHVVVTAWQGEQLVGAGRLLGDGARCGLVVDVAVLPEVRKRGIGRGLMAGLLQGTEPLQVLLTSTLEFQEFYRKLGFVRHELRARFPGLAGPSAYLEDA